MDAGSQILAQLGPDIPGEDNRNVFDILVTFSTDGQTVVVEAIVNMEELTSRYGEEASRWDPSFYLKLESHGCGGEVRSSYCVG